MPHTAASRDAGLVARVLARLKPPAPPALKSSATSRLIALETLRQPVWAPRDYAAFAREGFMQNPIVYRAVRMIAEAAASVPLLLYDGDEEITDHPLASLLARPNPTASLPDLLESWYGFLLVSGNAYLEAVSIDGAVRELHVLRPDRMKVVPGLDGWPEAYEYTASGNSIRFPMDVDAGVRPILHLKLFHPVNDHYGLSPIEAAAAAIDLHNTASKWNKSLLDNSARPSGALVYTAREGNLTPEQYDRLKSELEQGFQGAAHAGRPMLLEGGLDWKSMSLSPKDMDFIEARHTAAREIALALGVPPMLLGIPGDNTYSNYQEATRTFWRQTILPLVTRTAKALSGWLGDSPSPRLRGEGGRPSAQRSKEKSSDGQPHAHLSAPLTLRPDLDSLEALSSEREALWARVDKATFLTPNEKRAAVGYGEVRGGDKLSAKFNPNHDELGRFTFGPGGGAAAGDGADGQWVDDSEDAVGQFQFVADRSNRTIDLREEDARGGHGFRDHVGKTDEYLLAEVERERFRLGPFRFGFKQEGSFLTPEDANDHVNRALEAHAEKVDRVVDGTKSQETINHRFGYVTGKEAYKPDGSTKAFIRPTYEIRIIIRRDPSSPRGFRVHTAFPRNKRAGE